MAVTHRVFAMPSGKSIAARPVDDSGAYVPILAIQSGNAEQTFIPSKATVSGTCTLTFGGQTTAPISFTAIDPTISGTFHSIPVTPGVAVDLSMTVPQSTGFLATHVFCEVIENNLVTATANFNQDNIAASPDFTTPNTLNGGVLDANWKRIFPGYVPTTSSLSIRMTAPVNATPQQQSNWVADALHAVAAGADPAGGTIYDDSFPDGSHFTGVGFNNHSDGGYTEYYDGSFRIFPFGGGQGSTYSYNLPDIQVKLEALSTIGAGNVAVSLDGGGVKVEFINALGASAQPDITSSNPAVTFTRVTGGFVPTLHRTPLGGDTQDIVCKRVWIPGDNPTINWAVYAFDQADLGVITILPTDTLTITIPSGWMTTTGGEPTPGTYPVNNRVGGSSLAPFVAGPKTMGIGQGVQPDVYYSECLMYNNMAVRSGTSRIAPVGNGTFLEWDANGDPTLMSASSCLAIVTQAPQGSNDGVGGILPLNAPNGAYTFLWDGPADGGSVGGQHANFAELTEFRNLTGPTNNRLVYNIQAIQSQQAAPWINWNWQASGPDNGDGTFPCLTKNLRIYPPDPSDPTGMTPWLDPTTTLHPITPFDPSGKFHPTYLAKLATCQVVRPMQAFDTFFNPIADFDQYKPANWLDRSQPSLIRRAGVAEIRQYSGPPLDNPHIVVLQIKTTQPHGFFTGQSITLEHCGTATWSDPRFPDSVLGETGDLGTGSIDVIDDHTFSWHSLKTQLGTGEYVNNVTMTNVLTGAGACRGNVGTSIALVDAVDLVNLLRTLYPDVPRCLWFNVPVSATDACIDSLASYFAANLIHGITFRAELGNECWNFVYATYTWMRIRNFQIFGITDDSYAKAYSQGQINVNTRFQAAFTTAGRGSDFVHVFATQSSGTSNTDIILNYALSQGARVDEIATAPYVGNYNPQAFDNARANLMPADIHLDFLELDTDNPGYAYTAPNRAVIDIYYPSAKIVTYEGGWESIILGLTGAYWLYSNLWPLQHAIHRHPRMFGITLRLFQSFQDQGISLYTNFFLYGGSQYQAWSTWEWYGELPGTGDPSENPDYRDTSAVTDSPVKSQVGGAIDYWNSLVGASGGALVAGTATAGATTGTTAIASATEATGATGTIVHQWLRSNVLGQNGSPVSGQTSLTLSDSGLTVGATYYYRLRYTDESGAGSAVLSNQVALTTTGGGPSPTPSAGIVLRLLRPFRRTRIG